MKKDKTILFIAPVDWNYYPYRDQELPSSLASRGYRCIYLNPVKYKGFEKATRFRQVNKRPRYGNLEIIERNSSRTKSFAELLRENLLNSKAIRKYKPDAVISTDHLMSAGSCIYCYIKGIRFVFDITDNWELVDQSIAGKLYRRILKPLLARFAFAVTSTSQRQYNYFNSRRRRHTYLISNGINPITEEKLDSMLCQETTLREVNFISSLRDWYDFDLLIGVFKQLPELDLNIYGDGPLYADLVNKASGLSNIHIRGSVDSAETPGLLCRSLFGILPLKLNELNHSTCPIKLFDYWGAGKAVISTPAEEVMRIGGERILFATDSEGFLACIRKLIADRQLAEKLGSEGKARIKEVHNYRVITDQFVQILDI